VPDEHRQLSSNCGHRIDDRATASRFQVGAISADHASNAARTTEAWSG